MRRARIIQIVMVALVLAVGGGALALAGFTGGGGDFHGATVPPLFTDAQLQPVDAPLKAAEARGHRAAKVWLDAHPILRDAEFAAWAVTAVGEPPAGRAPAGELAQLKTLATQRDPAGTTAATWLESHGKKQPWKAILKQTKSFVPGTREKATKAAMTAGFGLGKTVQQTAESRYARPSPYVTDPSLSAGGVRVDLAGQVHRSYPSSHMVDAGVALALLEPLYPHLSSEYDWMADEIAFSRMYAGGHYLSDLTAGVFLGTLTGDYEARKAGLAS